MRTRKFLSTLIPALPMLLTALLVILVTVIFLTAMRSKAHAQFGGVEQPMFQMLSVSGETPQTLGANHWWIYSSMPTNINVTNWVDSIAGSVWTNGTTGNTRPTNSALGVHFQRGLAQQLTNSGVPIFLSGYTLWICMSKGADGIFERILSVAADGVQTLGIANDNRLFVEFTTTARYDGTITTAEGEFDFAWGLNSDITLGHLFYTNGIASITNTLRGSNPWKMLGGFTTFHLEAYIREIAIWTNTAINPTLISSLHQYATNKYGYTP